MVGYEAAVKVALCTYLGRRMNKNRAERIDKVKGFRQVPNRFEILARGSLPAERRTLREHTFKRFAAWKARVAAAKAQGRLRWRETHE